MMKILISSTLFLVLLSSLIGCTQAAPAPSPPPPAETSPPATANASSGQADDVYQPEIDPADFVDVIDNPYFPNIPGTKFIYEGETEDGLERIEVEILDETREVMGVTTTVIRDTAYLEGELIEDTFDWYAQDKDGNVWYFGEDTKEYEAGEVVSTAGSWEAGVDGAQPGIIMYADPAAHIGEAYRQEYYQDEAEDMAEVLSLSESEAVAYGSFDHLLMTKEWNLLEPGVVEHKYYAPGVGLILEVMVEGGSGRIELVEIQTQAQQTTNIDDDDPEPEAADDGEDETDEAGEANISPDQAGITADEARAAAEAAHPGTKAIEVELENENGTVAYEVELDNGLEVMVDAANGNILGAEQDDAD